MALITDEPRPSPQHTQSVHVEVYQRTHEGQSMTKEFQSYAAFLARESAHGTGSQGTFYSRNQDRLSIRDVSDLAAQWQQDPSHQRVILVPATRSPIDLPGFTHRLMESIDKGLGHPVDWVAIDHHGQDHSSHTHVLMRNDLRYDRPAYWYLDYQAHTVLTDLIGVPSKQEQWRQMNREPIAPAANEQVFHILKQQGADTIRIHEVAGLNRQSDVRRTLEGTVLGSGRADELTEDRFILLRSQDQCISFYRVAPHPLPEAGSYVKVNPTLAQRETLAQQILNSVTYSTDGHTYTASHGRRELELGYARKAEVLVPHVIEHQVQNQIRFLEELSQQSQWQGHVMSRGHRAYELSPQALDNLEFGRNLARPDDFQVIRSLNHSRQPDRSHEQSREREHHSRRHLGYDLSL